MIPSGNFFRVEYFLQYLKSSVGSFFLFFSSDLIEKSFRIPVAGLTSIIYRLNFDILNTKIVYVKLSIDFVYNKN